jgi:hypothetical protein
MRKGASSEQQIFASLCEREAGMAGRRCPRRLGWRRSEVAPCRYSAAATASASLTLFQVVSIQPSERWTCAMRNSSIWPLKGSDMPLTCRPMPGRDALR